MADPVIRARTSRIGSGVVFGANVEIEADELEIGDGAVIGHAGPDEFRSTPGVRISGGVIKIGANTRISSAVACTGEAIDLAEGVTVGRNSTIRVVERLTVGANGTIGENCEVAGRDIEIGQELWMLPFSKIGGGSAMEALSQFRAGHYLHVGMHCLINTARPVTIGHEVGLGTRTSIYTHGAYSSALMGFPVKFADVSIGDFTWIPGATINPGVRIGRNCVIAVNSLVNADVPDGSLAGGSPAKVLKEGAYPRPLTGPEYDEFFRVFFDRYRLLLRDDTAALTPADDPPGLVQTDVAYRVTEGEPPDADRSPSRLLLIASKWERDREVPGSWTIFDLATRRIRGRADAESAQLSNELRRYGVRFYSRPRGEAYVDWADPVPQSIVRDL